MITQLDQNLGRILLRDTSLSRDQLDRAMDELREGDFRLADILRREGTLPEDELLRAQAMQLGIEYLAKLDTDEVDEALVRVLPINYAKAHQVLPLHRGIEGVKVAVADPDDLAATDDLSTILGAEIAPVLVSSEALLDAINRVYSRHTSAVDLAESEEYQGEAEELVDIIDSTDEAPIIRWVNSLIFQAVKERASDIHIVPDEREVVVRYRIDGVLYETRRANRNYAASIAARVKIMAGLNIAEKRLPQDGRIRRRIAGKDIDMRVATAPTAKGERITIRLLDSSAVLLNLADIGLGADDLAQINTMIRRPHGILLVTGPTGSGKTTTLYAALSAINGPDRNILTIEDPVEYQLAGVSQVQVNDRINLTFASGLRSFLRHDPDVIMVGEIRDRETAEIAIQASLTGHLVLSTVHTNDAAGAITRLLEFDIEPFLVASSLLGMVAQRLVRKVCPECRRASPPTEADLLGIGLSGEEFAKMPPDANVPQDPRRPPPPTGHVYYAEGCSACLGTGYSGRLGIYEVLPMDDALRTLVLKQADASAIKRTAVGSGMRTLRMDGTRKVLAGATTVEEVMRVTQEDAR